MLDIYKYYNTYPNNEGLAFNPMVSGCFCKKSYLRVLNTTDIPLDFQVNEILMSENLNTGEFTKYIKLLPGTYHVKIHKANGNGKILFESDIDIDYNLSYTGVISMDDDIFVLMVPEEKENYSSHLMSVLRLANLSLDAPDAILSTTDGTILFSGIKYGNVSCNVAIPSGRYDMSLKTKDNKNILDLKMDLAPRMHYTLFITGKQKDGNIKIIIPEDGVNYLDLC